MKRILLLLSLLLALPTASAHDAQYQIVIKTNVMVAMRDGVKLATDLYLPAKEGAVVTEKSRRVQILSEHEYLHLLALRPRLMRGIRPVRQERSTDSPGQMD